MAAKSKDTTKVQSQPETPPTPPQVTSPITLPTLPPPPPPLGREFVSRRQTAQRGPRLHAYPGYIVIRVSEQNKQEWEADAGNRVAIKKDSPAYLLNAEDFKPDDQGYRRWKGMYLFAMTVEYYEGIRQAQLREAHEKIAGILPQLQQQQGERGIEVSPESHVDLSVREITNPQPVNPNVYLQHLAAMQGVTPQEYLQQQGLAQMQGTPEQMAAQMAQMYGHAPANAQGPYTLESLSEEDDADVPLSADEQAQRDAPAATGETPATAGPVLGAGAQGVDSYTPGPEATG